MSMEVEVIQDAFVLIPNKEHENFTETERKIVAGRKLFGEPRYIKGKRRGEPFTYKLFLTDNKEFIHLNKIKPMKTTEVLLGADAKQTPTVVDMAKPNKMFNKTNVAGALIGAGVGYYYSSKVKKLEKKKVIMWTIGAGILGYVAGVMIEKRRAVVIKPSK